MPNSLTNFTSPWRKGKVARLTFKKSSHTVQWQWGWWYWEGNRWPRSQTHVQLNSNSHMRCQGRFQMNCLNKKKEHVGSAEKGGKKGCGKSIGCVRNNLNGLNFLTGHQTVVLHLKACIDCACARHSLSEKLKGYLPGESARFFLFFLSFFAFGLGWALGTINARLM